MRLHWLFLPSNFDVRTKAKGNVEVENIPLGECVYHIVPMHAALPHLIHVGFLWLCCSDSVT